MTRKHVLLVCVENSGGPSGQRTTARESPFPNRAGAPHELYEIGRPVLK